MSDMRCAVRTSSEKARRTRHRHPDRTGSFVLAVVAAGCGQAGSGPASTASASLARETATVAYVNDGDTLRTTEGQRVRLVQIDAPELHSDCFGKGALAALRRLAPKGTRIVLVRDPAHAMPVGAFQPSKAAEGRRSPKPRGVR